MLTSTQCKHTPNRIKACPNSIQTLIHTNANGGSTNTMLKPICTLPLETQNMIMSDLN